MTCNRTVGVLFETHSHCQQPEFTVYICNCNAIRERDAHAAIESGACTVKAVFDHCQTRPQCAKCVCDIREMIDNAQITMAMAAE